MSKEFVPVTIEEVEAVWGNANFGPDLNERKMDVVSGTLLKYACGYSSGFTAFSILHELGLMTERFRMTSRGRRQLWEFFGEGRVPSL